MKTVAEGHIPFGFADKKGRTFGVLWKVQEHAGYPASDRGPAFEGGLFVLVWQTRDSKRFGAWPRDVRVADMDEAFAEIGRRAHGTMVRAKKLAVPV